MSQNIGFIKLLDQPTLVKHNAQSVNGNIAASIGPKRFCLADRNFHHGMNIRREGGKATLSHDVKMTREPPPFISLLDFL